MWRQEGQYLPPGTWLPAFITAISITPGNWNRSQNAEGEEEKQKGAWERILMRRKGSIKQGQLEVKAAVSCWKWSLVLPGFLTKQQSCSHVPRVCLLCPLLSPKGTGIPRVPQNQEGRDVLGTAGLHWGHWALGYSLLAFREAAQNVWLPCLAACGKTTFLCSDLCEVVLYPCGLVQGWRDSANLHLEDPHQNEESEHAAARGLAKPWKCHHMKLRKLQGYPKWICLVN